MEFKTQAAHQLTYFLQKFIKTATKKTYKANNNKNKHKRFIQPRGFKYEVIAGSALRKPLNWVDRRS